LWTLALNSAITAPPTYDAGRAFFSIEGNQLVAYDVASGKQLWLITSPHDFSPAAGDGLLFVASDKAIAALRQADGTPVWQIPLSERLTVPLVWDNGWLIAAAKSGAVIAFRAVDGREVWRHDVGAQLHTQPALAADRVYLATDDSRLISLHVSAGSAAWERRLGGPATSIVALDDVVYAGATDNYFYAVDAKKGDVLWRWQTGGDVVGRAAVDDSRVYFVSFDNVLRGMSRRSGAQIWKRALPMRPTSGPVLAGTTLLVSGLETSIRSYATKDGAPGADVKADGVIAAPPAIVHVPSIPEPVLLYVANDLAKGATVIAATHSPDPAVSSNAFSPLPNPIKP